MSHPINGTGDSFNFPDPPPPYHFPPGPMFRLVPVDMALTIVVHALYLSVPNAFHFKGVKEEEDGEAVGDARTTKARRKEARQQRRRPSKTGKAKKPKLRT